MKLFHYLLLLGLLARPGLLTSLGDSCRAESIQTEHDYTNTRYPNSCTDVESLADFAICLAQRNSFNKLLQCGSLPENEAWWAAVPNGSFLDGVRNSRYDLDFRPDDGKFWFTPKHLLMFIAQGRNCPSTHSSLGRSFTRCPFKTLTSYVQCLCCERVKPRELHSLRDECIYPPRDSDTGFWVKRSVLNLEPAIDYACAAACPLVPQDGGCPSGSFQYPRGSSNVQCWEIVEDGVLQPTPRGFRRDVEGEIDYSSLFEKYPLWVTTSIAPAPTRSIPTASSRTFDFAYESDYPLETVSEGEGEDDDFVSHDSTPTVADTTPMAADTTPMAADTTPTTADTTATAADTTGSDEPNVGAVFSSTDHIVLAFGLALVNLYHAMA